MNNFTAISLVSSKLCILVKTSAIKLKNNVFVSETKMRLNGSNINCDGCRVYKLTSDIK